MTSETQYNAPSSVSDTYDADSQLISSGTSTYAFDANGNPTGTGYVIGPDNQLRKIPTTITTTTIKGTLLNRPPNPATV